MTKTTTKRNQQGRNSGNTLATALANSGSKRSSERIKQRTTKADTASANDSSGSKGRECKSPALSKPRTGTFAVFGQSTPPMIRLQKGQPATGTVTEPTGTGIPAGQEGSPGVPSPTNTTNGVTHAGVLNGNGHGTDAATSENGTEASPLKDTAKVLFDPKVATTTSADGKSTKEASKGVERATKHKADDRVKPNLGGMARGPIGGTRPGQTTAPSTSTPSRQMARDCSAHKEALLALQALTACINLLHARGPKRLPREFRSFVTEPLYKIHATSLADRLSWLDTVDAANRFGRQRTWFNPICLVIDKFYRGGIIRRLQRSRKPPALRTTARAIQKTLLAITREDDPDDCQLPLPQTSF